VQRVETAAYCRARGLAWRADPTNDDPTFLRNRVRHHLLPVLRTYNPAIDATLARTASVLRDEGAWLDALTERRWRSFTRGPGIVQIPLVGWRRQPRGARRRLLRRAASWLSGDGDPLDFAATERALAHAATRRSDPVRLSRRLSLQRRGDRLELRREEPR
jgi:tRNA(Ile)-lysidine synthase